MYSEIDTESAQPIVLSHTVRSPVLPLSPFERLVAIVLGLAIFISGSMVLYSANKDTLVRFPRAGGTYTAGIVGTPRFINPLLAVSDADRGLTALVYAGLMTHNSDGALVPNLASGYTVSDDGTVYTLSLRDDLIFQDGVPITADDVVFTIEQVVNPSIRSPYGVHWEGVVAEALDDHTVVFTLPEPYAPFIENTTLGILPKHIWGGLTPDEFPFSQFNITPVGAGPYRVDTIVRDTSGIPSRYELAVFDRYALGEAYISRVIFRIYRSSSDAVTAFTKREVDAVHSANPASVAAMLADGTIAKEDVLRTPQLHTYGLFFNQNKQPVFLHDEVREAFALVTPKQEIIDQVLYGYGTVIDSPIPSFVLTDGADVLGNAQVSTSTQVPLDEGAYSQARAILEKAGWKRDGDQGVYTRDTKTGSESLDFSISTVNVPELSQSAEMVAHAWRALGANVEVKVYSATDLTQLVIRPRKFDVLLFGLVIGHELDLYAFWHSSQRNDPGLNVAQYAEIESDALLEKARAARDVSVRNAFFASFIKELKIQNPAIFLYSPDFIYLVRPTVQRVQLHPLNLAEERFDGITDWYMEVEHVWPFVRDWLK